MDIQKHLKIFLETSKVFDKTILVGVSAGADSTCLFHALSLCGHRASIHIVYIDHNWREESKDEAEFVANLAKSKGMECHLEKIEGIDPSKVSNIEEKFRDKRLEIFEKLYKEISASALLLAHHKDDQAETVFKRIFEGASIGKLSGLLVDSSYQSMRVLRPFLSIRKKEILTFLDKGGYRYFYDVTNEDEHYLRARMRGSIFPEIEKRFGKNAANNLASLGMKMTSIKEYLERKAGSYFELLCTGPFGSYLDLNQIVTIEPLEFETFLRIYLEKQSACISQNSLNTLVQIILDKRTAKSVFAGDLEIRYENHLLFFIKKLPKDFPDEIMVDRLPFGFFHRGYQFNIEEVKPFTHRCSWKDFWRGKTYFSLKTDRFLLKSPQNSERNKGKTLKSRYLEEKIPTFFRRWVFGMYTEGKLMNHPLLSSMNSSSEIKFFKLTIRSQSAFESKKVGQLLEGAKP